MQKMNVRLSTFSCRTRSTTYTSCSKLKQTISNHVFLIRWSFRWLRCWYYSFSVAKILYYWASKAESEIHWRHLIGQVYATNVLVIFMNNSWTRQLQFVFWSFYLFFGIWTALASWQFDKKVSDLLPIHLVAEKLAHAYQACLLHFVCLSSFKKGIHFRFTLTVSVP